MGIQKVLLNAGKCLINRAGIMTQRQMLAATTKVGRGITEAATKGDLSAQLAGNIIKKALPKGVKAPDFITLSVQETENWMKQTGLVGDTSALKKALGMAGGLNSYNPKNANSILYLNPSCLNGNVVAHEFRHHLDKTATASGKLKSVLGKLFMKSKKLQSISKRLSPITQKKYNELEQMIITKTGILDPSSTTKLLVAPSKSGLLSHLGVSEKDFDTFLFAQVNNLLTDVSRKDGMRILKQLIISAESERNAYFSGAKITRALGHIKKGESSYSDMSAVFHDELVKTLKQVLKQERKAYYKSAAGFSVPKRKIIEAKLDSKADVFENLFKSKRLDDAFSGSKVGKVIKREEFTDEKGIKTTVEVIRLDKKAREAIEAEASCAIE